MREYSSIHWRADEARLKTYSATARAKAGASVKIEIEVLDPGRLGLILEQLAEIQRDQDAPLKVKTRHAEPSKIAAPPRLLTYRSDK